MGPGSQGLAENNGYLAIQCFSFWGVAASFCFLSFWFILSRFFFEILNRGLGQVTTNSSLYIIARPTIDLFVISTVTMI
jgi:hypothetical protein